MAWRRRFRRDDAVDAAQRRLAALAERLRAEAAAHDGESGGAAPPPSPAPRETAAAARAPGRHAVRDVPERSRRGITPHHLAVLAIFVAVVIAVAAWVVTRAAPEPQPVQLSSERRDAVPAGPTTAGAVPDSTPSSAAPAPSPELIVDVTGKVRHPGIVELPAGSRVVDALDAAGGPRPGVDVSSLNLARLLVDGEQIIVGAENPAPAIATPGASAGTSTPTLVNLNTATLEQLDTLPGIGPVTAQAILDWRAEHGAFSTIDELMEVSGIGEVTFGDLEPYVVV